MEDKIKARIAALEAELERYIVQANAEIKAYQAAIGELKRLVVPVPPQQPEYIDAPVEQAA